MKENERTSYFNCLENYWFGTCKSDEYDELTGMWFPVNHAARHRVFHLANQWLTLWSDHIVVTRSHCSDMKAALMIHVSWKQPVCTDNEYMCIIWEMNEVHLC